MTPLEIYTSLHAQLVDLVQSGKTNSKEAEFLRSATYSTGKKLTTAEHDKFAQAILDQRTERRETFAHMERCLESAKLQLAQLSNLALNMMRTPKDDEEIAERLDLFLHTLDTVKTTVKEEVEK